MNKIEKDTDSAKSLQIECNYNNKGFKVNKYSDKNLIKSKNAMDETPDAHNVTIIRGLNSGDWKVHTWTFVDCVNSHINGINN